MKPNSNHHLRVLLFKRCGLPFGVDVADVREIRKFENLRPLAVAIPPLLGLVTLGERIIPVFDPHAFGADERPMTGRALTTIICGAAGAEIALVADEVQNQAEVRAEQVLRRPGGAAWLRGEVELTPGRKLILLAVSHLVRLARPVEPELQTS